MVKHDASGDPDWAGILGKLELNRNAIIWPGREALLPLDWQPEEAPLPDLLAVISLHSTDSKWQVRRRVAATLVWLPDSLFGELAARLTQDTHAYVRRDAERAIDRRQRGLQSRKSSVQGGLASEYSSMERLYGSMPTRKARRIVEKHIDALVGGTVHNMRGLLTPITHSAEEFQALANSGTDKRKLFNRHTQAIIDRVGDLQQFLDDMRALRFGDSQPAQARTSHRSGE